MNCDIHAAREYGGITCSFPYPNLPDSTAAPPVKENTSTDFSRRDYESNLVPFM